LIIDQGGETDECKQPATLRGRAISAKETKGNMFEERKKKRNGYPQPGRREEYERLVLGDVRNTMVI
jgi:hypothetical protein